MQTRQDPKHIEEYGWVESTSLAIETRRFLFNVLFVKQTIPGTLSTDLYL